MIVIHPFFCGPMDNILYIIEQTKTQSAFVVDPAWNFDILHHFLTEKQLTLKGTLLTHGHDDHINALPDLCRHYPNLPVFMSKHEASIYHPTCAPITFVDDNHTINFDGELITCLHTPGHSPGSQCFLFDIHLLTGDALFVDGCGHCRMPKNNPRDFFYSLQRLKSLPGHFRIYPGHHYGPTTTDTLGHQKTSNPYLKIDIIEEFVAFRMR